MFISQLTLIMIKISFFKMKSYYQKKYFKYFENKDLFKRKKKVFSLHSLNNFFFSEYFDAIL